MDFGQQRLQQQEAARQMMYQNSGYQFERRAKKTFILHQNMKNQELELYLSLQIKNFLMEILNIYP